MLDEIGKLLGWMIIVCYGLTVLNYVVKIVNRKVMNKFKDNKNAALKSYYIISKIIIKQHKLFGLLTILFIGVHFTGMFMLRGMSFTGIIAAALLAVQVLQGIYGAYINKKRTKLWLAVHRMIAVTLGIAIVVHIL